MLAISCLSKMTTAAAVAPSVRRTTVRALAAAADGGEKNKVTTLEDLNEVTDFRKSNPKSVLYFTAVWCPPCKQIKPVYHELSATTESVAFGLVDVDDNGDAAVEFQISAVPTFVFSMGETTMERFSGADPHTLQKHLTALVEAK